MSEYTFRFLVSQAADGVVFTAADSPNPLAPGNLAGWSSASFRLTDSNSLSDLEPDTGHWIGTVQLLPDAVINMIATYFPVKGSLDNVQLVGPIMMGQDESAIAIVGGGGKFAGARGQARCVATMSDKQTPLYRYELKFTV
jgi:hypothetical protein